jgi:type VI secretion system protein ImpG
VSFAHYYQTELAYYRALLQEYARKHPEVANIVSERNADPAVERLVQGASLLTARTRYQVEDDSPAIVQSLFSRMWPQFLHPVPALTLLQLTPKDTRVPTSERIVRGTMVHSSRSSDGQEASFCTTGVIEVAPLEITEAWLDRAHPADIQLRLRFQFTAGNVASAELDTLRIHFFGSDETRFGLYYWMIRCVRQVSVYDRLGRVLLESRKTPRPAGFESEGPLVPFLPTPNPGFRLLREYLTFPEKFIAVDVPGLDALPYTDDRIIDVGFHLGTPDVDNFPISVESFGLACGPVINSRPEEKLVISLEKNATSVQIEPTHGGEILQVHRVGCHRGQNRDWVEFTPYFAPGRLQLLEDRPCFKVLRLSDGVKQRVHVQITAPDGHPIWPESDHIVCWIQQSEHIATQLAVGAIDKPSQYFPDYLSLSNPMPVLPPEPLMVEQDRCWDLLALLATPVNHLATTNALNQLIHTLALQRSIVPVIKDVKSGLNSMLHKRSMVPVRILTIDVDEASLGHHTGHLTLFAEILDRLFDKSFDSNVFNQLTVRGQPSGRLLPFRPH